MFIQNFGFFSLILIMLGFLFFFCFFKFNMLMFFPFSFPLFDVLCLMDWISVLFMSILLMISGSVLLFNNVYMKKDMFFKRFTHILVFFVFSMMFLIMFPFSIMFFLGWDGLGMLSFLLVKYYKSKSSWNASMKTYLMNRLGDGFFILFFSSLFLMKNLWLKEYFCFKLSFLFVLGCFTKSAQVPFSTWLPAAMAAPTPVSSLVHSSTLVTAGVYMLFRFWKIYCCFFNQLILYLSLLTGLLASLAASFEWDSKKIIAFSTLSNLGMMVFSLGLGLFVQCFFHLLTHAVSKAKLFVNVGYMMIKKNHHQDSRFLSKNFIKKFLPSMFSIYSIFSLSGMIFFSGFFSKENILEKTNLLKKYFVVFLIYLMILFSLIYGFRLILLLKFNSNMFKVYSKKNSMNIWSVFFLTFFSIFLGKILKFYFLKFSFSVKVLKLLYYILIFVSIVLFSYIGFFWGISEVFYLQYFKSSFWMKTFSPLGKVLFNILDFGLFFSMEKNIFLFLKNLFINFNFFSLKNFSILLIFLGCLIFIF